MYTNITYEYLYEKRFIQKKLCNQDQKEMFRLPNVFYFKTDVLIHCVISFLKITNIYYNK